MKTTGKRPKCGGTDIIAGAKAIDRGHGRSQYDQTIATFRRPEALIFEEKQETTVSAWVCAACGFVEFYADYPHSLKLPETFG